jgi:hypothetical protein
MAADNLPEDLSAILASLPLLDDDALWRAARDHLPSNDAAQIEALHNKRQTKGLTSTEQATLATLVQDYERYMLIRSRAAALLHECGHDVSSLLASSV